MTRRVLFSPVGGTDPISADNMMDGSMLHIARKRLPDAVYLYLSKEMIRNQKLDQRYTRALEKLSAATGHHIDFYLIERPNLTKVHDFDVFYWDFRNEISGIIEKEGIESPEELLVNISSGTPAMKSALVVLNAMIGVRYTLVQVATPEGRMGNHTHPGDYDFDTYWDLDEDNRPDSNDRTKDIRSTNLLALGNLQTIRNFVDKYDYDAAWELAQTLPPEISGGMMPFLRLGRARSLLNLIEARQACADAGLDQADIFPAGVGDSKGKVFEYALCCDIKRRRGELADFIRSLSPLIVELFELIIEKQLGIYIEDYCTDRMNRNGSITRVWDSDRIFSPRNGDKGAEFLAKAFREKYGSKTDLGCVFSDHLAAVIESACGDDVSRPVSVLRGVEQTIRNKAAHEIVSVDEKSITRLTRVNKGKGLGSEEIMNLVRDVASLAGFPKQKGWDSYDHMNELIKNAIRTAGADSGMTADALQD